MQENDEAVSPNFILSLTNHRRGRKRGRTTMKIAETKYRKRSRYTISAPLPTITQSGEVLVTGAGDVGQLGLGSGVVEKARPTLVTLNKEIIDVGAGAMHTVCLTKDGKVITFGCNDDGALGRTTPEEEDFDPAEVELPGKAIQISTGDSHTAVLLKNGKVYAWGTFRDSHGSMGLTMNGKERLPCEMLPGETVVKIASGSAHLVMLTIRGEVFTCGCAEQGQLGRISQRLSDRKAARNGMYPLLTPRPIHSKVSLKLVFENIWAGSYCTFAKVVMKDEIYVFGLNNYNQIGMKSGCNIQFTPKLSKELSNKNWKQICGGSHHTILLDEDGKVFSIGRKEYGRLGLGEDCEDATEPQQVLGLNDKYCVYIGSCDATCFAITNRGDLYGWGMGDSGQLGTGEEGDCVVPTLIKVKDRLVQKVSPGGMHTVFLAVPVNNYDN